MVKMLTLFGVEDLRELKYNDLKRELRCQKFIRAAVKHMTDKEVRNRNYKKSVSQISIDKETFADIYVQHLDAFIREIEFVMAHRSEPLSNWNSHRSRKQIRQENEAKRKAVIAENRRVDKLKHYMEYDGLYVSWSRERFMLIAQDRGYQTEEAIIQDVGRELNFDLAKAKLIIDKGRFTWGQVLCLGAMLEMTPKEFCDVFLAGYFIEQHGEFRANYENLRKEELLKFAIKPLPPK